MGNAHRVTCFQNCWYASPEVSDFKALGAFRRAAAERDADDGLPDSGKVRLLGIDPLGSILCSSKYGFDDPAGRSFEVSCQLSASYPRSPLGEMTFVLAPDKIDAKLHCTTRGYHDYEGHPLAELKAEVDLRPMSDREKLERPGSVYESPEDERREMLTNIFSRISQRLSYVCRPWKPFPAPSKKENAWKQLVKELNKKMHLSRVPLNKETMLKPMSTFLEAEHQLGEPIWNQMPEKYSICFAATDATTWAKTQSTYILETIAFTDSSSSELLDSYYFYKPLGAQGDLLREITHLRTELRNSQLNDRRNSRASMTPQPVRSLSFVGRSRESVAVTSRASRQYDWSWTISRSCLYETATEAFAALEESWKEAVDAAEMRDSEVDEYIPPNKARKNNALQTKVRLLGIDPLSRVVGDDCHPSDEAVFQVVCELIGGSLKATPTSEPMLPLKDFPNSQNMLSLLLAAEELTATITCTIKDGIGSRMINAKEANVDLRHMSEREIEESNEHEETKMDSWRQYLSVMGVSNRGQKEMLIRIFMNEFTKKQVTVCRRWLTAHAPQDSAAAWKTVVERTKIILTANPKKKEPHSVPLAKAFLELDRRQAVFGPPVWNKPPPTKYNSLCLRIEETEVDGVTIQKVAVTERNPQLKSWLIGDQELWANTMTSFGGSDGEIWRQVALLRQKKVKEGSSHRTTTRNRKNGGLRSGPAKFGEWNKRKRKQINRVLPS